MSSLEIEISQSLDTGEIFPGYRVGVPISASVEDPYEFVAGNQPDMLRAAAEALLEMADNWGPSEDDVTEAQASATFRDSF